jgi:hypothetical protein
MMCKETKFRVLPYSNLSVSWSVHVGFVVDTVPIRQFFSVLFGCTLPLSFYKFSVEYCIHPPPMLHNLSNQQRLLTNRFFPLSLSLSLSLLLPPSLPLNPRSPPRPLRISYLSDFLCSNESDISNERVVFNTITSGPKLLVVLLTHFTQNTELSGPLSSEYAPLSQ